MSGRQHNIASQVLKALEACQSKSSKKLNYSALAESFGMGARSARAVAQACDKLDAAAALARLPLLALERVRSVSGEINPRAWSHRKKELRDRILEKSSNHDFSNYEMHQISLALEELKNFGNHKAWDEVYNKLGGEDNVYNIIAGNNYQDQGIYFGENAIDDIGVDEPTRSISTVSRYARDPKIRDAVLKRAGGKCEFCGALGFDRVDDTQYLESHHIIALANDGADRMTNVIALCPNDHRKAHFGKNRHEIEEEMIKIVKSLEKARTS